MSLAERISQGRTKARATRLAAAVFAGSVAIAGAQAANAQSVVVRATGPSSGSYPAGKRLPANAQVTLKNGDQITVLDKAGTRVLRGPGTFSLDGSVARDRTAGTRVSQLMSSGISARARTGAVRGAGSGATPPTVTGPSNIWHIDASKGGTWCVADPSRLVLWRPDRVEEATATLSGQNGSSQLTWKRGSALKQWPDDMTVVDNATYTLALPGASPVTIITRVLPRVPADDMAAVGGMLADAGCSAQLNILADAAAADAEAADAQADGAG